LQSVREALTSKLSYLEVETLYLTENAQQKYAAELNLSKIATDKLVLVSEQVMRSMTTAETPQGILAVCENKQSLNFWDFIQSHANHVKNSKSSGKRIAYFWQIQDPGNAGTVIRAADAFGFDAVIFSDNSVDIYSPKVIRSTAGSIFQIKVVEEVSTSDIKSFSESIDASIFTTKADGDAILQRAAKSALGKPSIWVFGNEARGLPNDVEKVLGATTVSIPMSGKAESLNLATAASVVMYAVSNADK
jgi:TrmH family RNA methyltransferase